MNAAAEFSWIPDSETELRTIFDLAPFGLAQCECDGEITLFNPALERMFRNDFRTGRAVRFGDLIDAEHRSAGEQLLHEMFAGKRDGFSLATKNSTTGDVIRWMGWRAASGPKRPYAMFLAQRLGEHEVKENEIQENEIQNAVDSKSDLERQQRQAQSLEAMGRLAGGVAHDFNNLLTGVLLYCDLLVASLDTDHAARRYVEEIRNAGMQATDLVRQLLALARPTSSESRLLSLNDIAEGMRNLLLRLIGENIQLEFHLDPTLGLIEMDQTQAQQILLNLVLNARDAMPGGGQIKIETSPCRVQILREAGVRGNGDPSLPCVRFAVEDQGNGMDEATRARIFEPFFTTKSARGTGLGLATVKDIVTRHGGLIHVDSVPDQGTTVNVFLPEVPAKTPQNIALSQRSGPNLSNPGLSGPDLFAASLPERKEGEFPTIREE